MPLRTTRSDNGTLVPAADAAATTSMTQVVLTFDDNRLALQLFGQYGQNLALIERRLGVVVEQRGNNVTIEGSRDGCEQVFVPVSMAAFTVTPGPPPANVLLSPLS